MLIIMIPYKQILETRTSITRQQNQGFKATIEKENEETG
jgi:hypothetical protein